MSKITRRDFLRGAAGMALGGTLAGLTGGALSAFADNGEAAEKKAVETSAGKKQIIHHHESAGSSVKRR